MNVESLAKSLAVTEADDAQAVKDVRKMVIDICRQNGGGHGGSAIGMAPLAIALWRHTMRYNPANASWFDRDRFVLSNGHAAMLLYTMLHVTGYPHMTVDELKLYGSAKSVDPATGKWQSTLCHGHPEREVPGVEVTTGPLGQGIASAVGLALASKQLGATFNKPGFNVVNSHIYCVTGDGCLQEGVANEAMALAGHLRLDTLTVLYDNNAVTCDGPLDWIASEDTNAKVRALGWHVIDVFEGDTSVAAITKALAAARLVEGKPTFINIRTTIGYGTSTAGTFKSHHGTYTDADAALRHTEGVEATHTLSPRTQEYLTQYAARRGATFEKDWTDLLSRYTAAHPAEGAALASRMAGDLVPNGDNNNNNPPSSSILSSLSIPSPDTDTPPQATRTINGHVFAHLMTLIPGLFASGADLWNSNQMMSEPLTASHMFSASNPGGRVLRAGIREHAMVALSNGLAAYAPNTFLPVTATFFRFYLYAAPAVRMGALQGLRAVHVATHDSIGEGQNGATHQPVEVDSLFRAMPGLRYVRPGDGEEVVGAWMMVFDDDGDGEGKKGQKKGAMEEGKVPVIISLARDPPLFPIPRGMTDRHKVLKGGYAVRESVGAEVTLVSCGSELQFAVEGARMLEEKAGIKTRVVSIPCISRFEAQSQEYQDAVLGGPSRHVISVEAYVSSMWARLCTASIAMDSFGYSGAGAANFARFGLDADGVFRKVRAHVQAATETGASMPRWTLLK